MARFKKNQNLSPDAPLLFEDHGRPVSRRQFIRQGMMAGSATILTGSIFDLIKPNSAMAAIAPDLVDLQNSIGCSLVPAGAGTSVPFICFDLAGGANLAGSNVLVGQAGGQRDLLSTAGYSKLGLPGDMLPGQDSTAVTLLNPSLNNDFTNEELNLIFHADSPMLLGIRERAATAIATGRIDGTVIPARSDNDTGNNPHSPLYGLVLAGARGSVVDLIGSRSSVSGGNSMAPPMHINPEFRPTKVDRPSDVTGMVDVGDLTTILGADDVTAVMESISRVTHKKMKLGTIATGLTNDDIIKDLIRCNYLKAADITNRFANTEVDPTLDPFIVGPTRTIFSTTELANDGEFRKTASVMKMVMEGYAAGGCVTMGGYDYHTGDRNTGENRDLRAGRCIGACLEYAEALGKPLMVYVFSDGSVFSNGAPDNSASSGLGTPGVNLGGGGKGQWTGDNSSTACSYFLAYDPVNPVTAWNGNPDIVSRRQIGQMSAGASVVTSATPAANNVNLLVNMVLLNYMALNGSITPTDFSAFTTAFPNHGLGNSFEDYIAFSRILPP